MMKSVLRAVGVAAMIFMVGCGDDNGVNPDNGGGGGSFINPRDGQPYRTVVMPDGKTWMAENLNNVTANSWCYDNNSSNCDTYGRLYTWDAARVACPIGWRLPTMQEWQDLISVAGGSVAGTRLKASSPRWNGTDDFGFSALPGGNRWQSDGRFIDLDGWGIWWSAAENVAERAWRVGMSSGRTNVDENWNYKSNGYSVRCVRD